MSRGKIYWCLLLLLVLADPFFRWLFPQQLPARTLLEPPITPHLSVSVDLDMSEQILMHNLWDRKRGLAQESTGMKAEKTVVADWVLLATGESGAGLMAMIRVANDIEVYYAGDMLPDGTILLRVFIDGILTGKDGEEEYVYLFGKNT